MGSSVRGDGPDGPVVIRAEDDTGPVVQRADSYRWRTIAEAHRPNIALQPMGDHRTMAPPEAAIATRLLDVPRVIPMHYGITPEFRRAPSQFLGALRNLRLRQVDVGYDAWLDGAI